MYASLAPFGEAGQCSNRTGHRHCHLPQRAQCHSSVWLPEHVSRARSVATGQHVRCRSYSLALPLVPASSAPALEPGRPRSSIVRSVPGVAIRGCAASHPPRYSGRSNSMTSTTNVRSSSPRPPEECGDPARRRLEVVLPSPHRADAHPQNPRPAGAEVALVRFALSTERPDRVPGSRLGPPANAESPLLLWPRHTSPSPARDREDIEGYPCSIPATEKKASARASRRRSTMALAVAFRGLSARASKMDHSARAIR